MRLHVDENMPDPLTELPRGEHIVWQGTPDWKRFAIHAFHVRKLAVYFVALFIWRWANGTGAESHFGYLTLAAMALGIVTLLAWSMARSTTYSITNKRVTLSFGVTMPMHINIPFGEIDGIDLKLRNGGVGDVAIRPCNVNDLSFFLTWPHVRAWRFRPVEPLMRCIPDAASVARGLTQAMLAERDIEQTQDAEVRVVQDNPLPKPPAAQEQTTEPPLNSAWPLYGALALVAVTVFSVFWVTSNKPTAAEIASAQSEPVQTLQLSFEDRSTGEVDVVDAQSGRVLDTLASGSNNFLRVTLRGLVRARVSEGDVTRSPFLLQRLADGAVVLSDPVTARRIDLRAFGELNAVSFTRFLDMVDATAEVVPDTTTGPPPGSTLQP